MEVGTGVIPFLPERLFKAYYYETLDTVIGCISDRFNRKVIKCIASWCSFLIMEKQNEEDINEMLKFYGSDFEKDKLITQLHLFHAKYPP